MRATSFVVIGCVVLSLACQASAEGDFPPPPLPKAPAGFNIHCDVCETLMHRAVPYCERTDENMDYLPDFCVFNYNRVLREECDYLATVMDYVWCPNACSELRSLKSFGAPKICHHPLVNCTERFIAPSTSPSPSPSPSAALPQDCMLCQFVLKHVAEMCMNNEQANKRNIYHVCMRETSNKAEFEHCTMYLNELVVLADTQNPCSMLQCDYPSAVCQMDDARSTCHVAFNDKNATEFYSSMESVKGRRAELSAHEGTQGLGPGDFRPGPAPYHSLVPRAYHAPRRVRAAGHLRTPQEPVEAVDSAGIQEQEQKQVEAVGDENDDVRAEPEPTPVPLKDVKMS